MEIERCFETRFGVLLATTLISFLGCVSIIGVAANAVFPEISGFDFLSGIIFFSSFSG
ncbi:MAG: hypothetical protein KDC84_09800 [Crocinitomicaceae bacterium]|nr:hypothetical protein [Crocinitomicaceae bacterium]